MSASRYVLPAALCILLLGCEPPGKPKEHEAQAENREAVLDFAALYKGNCAGCHGLDGRNGPARILNDAVYLTIVPRQTLRDVVANGRPGTDMPAWAKSAGGPLTDKQIDALADGMYRNWARGMGAAVDAPSYSASAPGDPVHGKQLFARNCFMCHGKGAATGTVTTPDYLELVSTQMLRTAVIVGRTDLGMPNYQNLSLGKALSDRDVTDLVAYLNSLRTGPAPGESGASQANEDQKGVK